MGLNVVVSAAELRKALKEIEIAEANGFAASEAVFELISAGKMLSDNQLGFEGLVVRGYPNDPSTNWGRTDLYKRSKFVEGRLEE